MNSTIDTVVLDLDGTLVDSVYVHALCWHAAFRDVGVHVASHHIHRAIGMGSDRLVAHVAGDPVERAMGDEVRRRHAHHLGQRFGEITATPGAAAMLEALHDRGLRLVLASSGERDQAQPMLDLVEGAQRLLMDTVSGSDAEHSKPAGDLVSQALQAVGAAPECAVLIGDAVWDARAGAEAKVACIGVLTGGITEAELREAGCTEVYDTPGDLVERLSASPLLGGAGR
ncbi:HAD family hydrolase [Nocardioides sp. cx-173]|uniref:HAD family hydrolase n=1 Tax=Nocardioides sp. cx-173 TaxID=2898796 RepID=UPI001E4B6A7A|nr:HAD family hydrolase [Nocardioides sp. cx-173]MCD4524630.1 HAD family hydrolase [Nocardioides sp. cx-173]UGB42888.1 HAD family hydrolase [Nocardioides sp. cx-173]